MSRPEHKNFNDPIWKQFSDQPRHKETMDKPNEEMKKSGLTVMDGIISVMIDKIMSAEEKIQSINAKVDKLELTIKSNQDTTYDDRSKSINTENDFREKIMKLTTRVDKLDKPMSSHRSLSYQSPYHVSDLYLPLKPTYA